MKILSPSECIEKMKKFFDKKDLIIVITAAIVFFAGNINFLLSDAVAHDGLAPEYTYYSSDWELSLGRFLLPMMENVRFGIVNKAVILLISAVFLILGLIFLRRVLKIDNKVHLFFMSIMVAVLPCFVEILYYTFCADSYFIAFFLSVLSIYLLERKKKTATFFAILSVIATAAIYQAFLAVTAGLIVVVAIKSALESKELKETIKHFIFSGIIMLVGLVLYYVIAKLVCMIGGFEMASYKGANDVGISTIIGLPKGIVNAFRDFLRFYFRDNGLITNNYYHRTIPYAIAFVTVGIATIASIKNLKEKRFSRGVFIVIMLFFLTLAVNLTDIIAPSSRMLCLMTCGQVAVIGLIFVIVDKFSKGNIENLVRFIMFFALVMVSWTFFLSNTYTQVLKNHTYERFNNFAGDVITRATSLEDYDNSKEWMISYEYGSNAIHWEMGNGGVSTEGVAWDWFDGLTRYPYFFNKYYGFNYTPVSEKTYNEIKVLDEFKEMPVYPDKGSVKIINDVVVVKTSKDTY